jgi:hypothetical protein
MSARFHRRRSPAAAHRRRAAAVVCLALTGWWTATASAQLDPLLFARRVPPTVIIVVDTSMRMLEDGAGNYYDPNDYIVSSDPTVASALGVSSATRYRRTYSNLQYENVQDSNSKFEAVDIKATPDTSSAYASFFSNTRMEIAKTGIGQAVSENAGSTFRWGLIRLRQQVPAWRLLGNCDKPVRLTGNASLSLVNDSSPCNAGSSGRFGIYAPGVGAPNYSIETLYGGGAQVVAPGAPGSAQSIVAKVQRGIGDPQALIPAGAGSRAHGDRPISHALDDARAAAVAAMTADSAAMRACRNTVVVLITSGADEGDPSYMSSHDAPSVASTFMSVTASGVTMRVPIHVLAIKPAGADVTELQAIAANSGGRYVAVTSAVEVTRQINYAVQAGFARPDDIALGRASEFVPVSPIVGTVNLKNAKDALGNDLPNTDIIVGGEPLPQRSNMMLTAGFSLPGFDGVLRAFRVFRPEPDNTKPTGWKFVSDGTQLWPDLDGRPELAGQARAPKDPDTRNIYTFIPDGAGGGSMVAFTAANEPLLRAHMNVTGSATSLIGFVRSQGIGAIIGSTPALMDVPSLDPPPDDDYGFADSVGTFAGTYKNRRAMIFFGANDGMIHAVDARTGYEVWAFIPYNLLPKLKTLEDGQPMEQFDYFVDSSPKIAEVKLNGVWRSLLVIGQGPGGTFYQAFDVTGAGMNVVPALDGTAAVDALLDQFDTAGESITFEWAFPNYSSFNPAYTATFTVSDATSGGKVKLYGDLKASATTAEKTVGFTWSDPAVGPLDASRTTNAVIVGSGYFPDIEPLIPARAGGPRAGNALYLIDAATGTLIGNPGGSCAAISNQSGSSAGCAIIGEVINGRKNALQADPTAAGEAGSIVVTKAYLGDIDGNYWRFNFVSGGAISVTRMIDTSQPIYASSALLFIGTAEVYMFFSTGSDLLPTTPSSAGGTGTFRLIGLKDNAPAGGATVKFEIDLASTTNSNGLATGERPSTSPSVAGDIVFYSTTTETAATPCADFTGKLYAVSYLGGAAYDSNDNGKIDKNESPVAATVAGRATAPFIVDQHLYLGTVGVDGAKVEAFGDPEDFNNGVGQVGVRILSWREIR